MQSIDPAFAALDGHGHATRQAADRLRDFILDGGVVAGDHLSERMIRERLNISRTPLREALKMLSVEGLVTLLPNRGAIVTKLTLAELLAAYELLAALDGCAGELACERASTATVAEIEALHGEMVRRWRRGDLLGYFKINKQIHLAIVDAADNPALARVYRAEAARVDRFRFAGNRDPTTWQRAVRQHEQMVDALKLRHGALLREVLISHRRIGAELARATFAAENPQETDARAAS